MSQRDGRLEHRNVWWILLVGLIVLQSPRGLPAQQLQPHDDPAKAETSNSIWLKRNGIESSVESFRRYFENLSGPEYDATAVGDLIESLSSEDFQIREQATHSLKTVPSLSVADLKSLAEEPSVSPEGRYRLQEVIRVKQNQDPAQIQYAILSDIRDRKLAGLAESIIQSYDSLETDRFVRHASIQALMVTTEASDVNFLSSVLLDSKMVPEIRVGALKSIYRLSPELARQQVMEDHPELLEEAEGVVGLEVARILVLNKRPQAFEMLFRLLRDEKLAIRNFAAASLVRMTQLEFERDQVVDLDQTDAIIQKVNSWLIQNADDVNYQWYNTKPRLGRRLVSQYDADRVIELDEAGNVVWSVQAEKPFACLGLPNGHRYILLYSEGSIVEYDGAGRLVKKLAGLPSNISSICRRENGNLILAAGQNGNLILEIDSAGNQVNSFKLEGKPTSAEIGLNGNLVVSLYSSKQIVEVDSNGKIINQIQLDGEPYHVTPLISGNFLVAFAQDRRIIECDQNGKVIFKIDCKKYAYHAQKLEDGTISFADETGIFRVDESGKEIVGKSYRSVGKVNYMFSY